MDLERWDKAKELYHAALEREPSQRAAFLDEVCAGDDGLRREIESLLAYQEKVERFIEAPAMEMVARALAHNSAPSLAPGQQVSHYKILSLLGTGGMGEVYLTLDTRLDRKVALKILTQDLAADPGWMRRFVREAKAASALSHSNVATIHDVGEADGVSFITMEYVEGQTLASRMSDGALDLADVVAIGIQVADALDAAQAKGITHRDIKPDNIMLTPRGQAKVLDFGLARITGLQEQTPGSEIVPAAYTSSGAVMGSAPYMSPEQVLGREVDHRSDIFGLGVSLYEMTTGHLPFAGATLSETTDRILHADVEAMQRINPNAPAELERIVRKCLEKDPARRYQSARDLLVDLGNLERERGLRRTGLDRLAFPRSTGSRLVLATAIVLVLALAAIPLFRLPRPNNPGNQPVDSIAVLPFVNVSGDPESEYLSDGITENLINSLSQIPNLRVLASTTVFRFKGRDMELQKVGRELGVQAVLTGRVVARAGTLVISTELVDVARGTQLWGERYNRNLGDIFAVQDDLATQIVEKLRFKLTAERQKRLNNRYSDNTEAYHLYLKGRYYVWRMSQVGVDKVLDHYHRALQIDPTYAPAYVGLAEAYVLAPDVYMPANERWPKAKEAVLNALALDDTLGDAHGMLGRVLAYYEWDWKSAEREFTQAIQLNPGIALTHSWYGFFLGILGRAKESIVELERAQQLDPLSSAINTNAGRGWYWARQYDAAIEQFRNAIDLQPDSWLAHLCLAMAFEQKGMYAEAIAEYRKTGPLGLRDGPAWVGRGLAVAGNKVEARRVLDELMLTKPRRVGAWGLAALHTALGDNDQAFEWLQRAVEGHHPLISTLKVEPAFDSLHSDPRFADLLVRMGLAP